MKSKTQNFLTGIIFICMAFVLSACNVSNEPLQDPLHGTEWQLYAYRKTKPLPDTGITATFEDGQLSGSAGCNTYFAAYNVQGDKITISEWGITEMACLEPEGVMQQELLFMEFLVDAQRYRFEVERLMIFNSDGEALTFVPQ